MRVFIDATLFSHSTYSKHPHLVSSHLHYHMRIRFLFANESSETLEVDPSDSLQTTKSRFSSHIDPSINCSFLYLGGVIDPSKPIRETALAEGSTVHVVVRRQGVSAPSFPVSLDYSVSDRPLLIVGHIAALLILSAGTAIKRRAPENFDTFSTVLLYFFWGVWIASVTKLVISR